QAALCNIVALRPAAINLRTAGNFAILAETGVSTVVPSVITGNVGVSPIAAIALTGFSLTLASSGESATSSQVTGELFTASYVALTPATLSTAIADMGTAGQFPTSPIIICCFLTPPSGAISGLALAPGLYKWTGAVSISSEVFIVGGATDTFIFQIAGGLSIAAAQQLILASNIVWVVSGTVSVGAGAHIEGVVLGKTSITLITGASANSRLLAQTDVALQK
ncbi:antifreeze protein, partial [Mycena maculata]